MSNESPAPTSEGAQNHPLVLLLSRLAGDDGYRASFEADPRAALAELDIRVPDDLFAGLTLPPKEAFGPLLVSLLAPGQHAAMPQTFGPQTFEPQTFGPQTFGPQTFGPQTFGPS